MSWSGFKSMGSTYVRIILVKCNVTVMCLLPFVFGWGEEKGLLSMKGLFYWNAAV